MNEKLMDIVNKTLDRLYENERYIFENDSSERNIVFHFSRYFIKILEEEGSNFIGYNVDCEYNRNKIEPKVYKDMLYQNKKHRIFPDFIFHKRGCNENNMLAIEFKKSNNTNKSSKINDFRKLEFLTDNYFEYRYRLGLFIQLGEKREAVKVIRFINGQKI